MNLSHKLELLNCLFQSEIHAYVKKTQALTQEREMLYADKLA